MVYRIPRKHLVARAWPCSNAFPYHFLADSDAWALSQLRLQRPFRAVEEHSTPDAWHIFAEHLTTAHLHRAEQDMDADSDTESEPGFGTMNNAAFP